MIYVLGNGESRRDVDVEELKTKGKVYGCNGIYRDHVVDVLVSGDHNMQHEIYSSEYALKNKCYFAFWNPMPVEMHPYVMESLKDETVRVVENNHYADTVEFVVQGHSISKTTYVCWLALEDKVRRIEDCFPPIEVDGVDMGGFSTGNMAVYIAAEENPGEEIELIGFDHGSKLGEENNIYKGTKNYAADPLGDEDSIKKQERWKSQMKYIIDHSPDNKFHGVNL